MLAYFAKKNRSFGRVLVPRQLLRILIVVYPTTILAQTSSETEQRFLGHDCDSSIIAPVYGHVRVGIVEVDSKAMGTASFQVLADTYKGMIN